VRKSGLKDPLKRPVFRRLATTYAVNELGDWMGIVALSVLVFDHTESAFATTALFLGTGFLPAFVAPLFVARLEQPPPRFVLPVLYCGEAAAFGALALLADNFSLAAVVAIAAVDGALALASRALTRAVVAAQLEPVGELRAGNAILNVAFTGGSAVGPAVAGLVVAGLGVSTALVLNAVSFYVTALVIFRTGTLPQAEPEPGRMRERVRAGIAYIRERPTVRWLLIAQGAASIFFTAVLPIEVIYATETLGASDSGYGLLLASWGTGMVVGSVVFAAVRGAALPTLLFFSTLAIGFSYLGLAVAPTLALACAASVLGGAGNGVQWVALVSAVQELTAQSMQARVMSVLESVSSAMPGLGFLLGGITATLLDPRVTFLVAGFGVLAIVAIMTLLLGTKWLERRGKFRSSELDSGAEIMVELIPAGRFIWPEGEASLKPKGEVAR
jgi:MFS family permease